MPFSRSSLARVALFAGSLAFAVTLLEVSAQLVHRISHGRWRAAGPEGSVLMEPHPFLVARPRASVRVERNGTVISLTPMHTRWTGAHEGGRDRIRIACLGGSTTFGVLADDADTWPAILQERLGDSVEVRNYGVPGYSTAEHAIQMALVVNEWRPDVAVFYVDWNDLNSYHDPEATPDYFGHGMKQFGVLDLLRPASRHHLMPALLERSGIVWLAERLRSRLGIAETGPPDRVTATPSSESDPQVDHLYARNLATILALTRSIDAVPVFVPQQVNASAFEGGRASRPWTARVVDRAVPGLIHHLNEILARACTPPCVFAEEVANEGFATTDFIDDGHFSRAGAERFSEALERTLRRVGVPNPSSEPSAAGRHGGR